MVYFFSALALAVMGYFLIRIDSLGNVWTAI
jgi:hypothetical protein